MVLLEKESKTKNFKPSFSDEHSDSESSDNQLQTTKPKSNKNDQEEAESEVDDFEDDSDSDDDLGIFKSQKKSSYTNRFRDEDDDEDDNEDDQQDGDSLDKEEENEDIQDKETTASGMVAQGAKRNRKLKKLNPEQLAKEEKKIKKTGVCYLSRVPPYMKPAKLRSVLSRFGKIDRLFLKPEDSALYHKRVKYGGNKKKNFTEGWIEFVNKKDAKLCAATLNGNKLGGKKTSYYYDDIINIKYLSGFKWFDLTQQIAKENEVRQAKLAMELSQQSKLNKNFITNVERSKMVSNIQKKRKAKQDESGEPAKEARHEKDIEVRRTFKQRKVTSTRADAKDELKERTKPNDKLNDVLSRVF